MQKKILFIYFILILSSNDSYSQQGYTIDANLRFNPGIIVGIHGDNAFILKDVKGVVIPIEIRVSNNSPFNFKAIIPKVYENTEMEIKVSLTTYAGEVYVSDDKYTRYGKSSYFKNIWLSKTTDLFAKYKAKMDDDCDFNSIEASFNKAIQYSSNPSQKLEVFRISSQRHYECGNKIVSLTRLEDAFVKINFNKFDLSKKNGYWKDRINYLLKAFEYTNSSFPARDFGRKLEKNQIFLKIWKKLIEDFKTCYAEKDINCNDFSATGIKNQVETIDTFMNPNAVPVKTLSDKELLSIIKKKKKK